MYSCIHVAMYSCAHTWASCCLPCTLLFLFHCQLIHLIASRDTAAISAAGHFSSADIFLLLALFVSGSCATSTSSYHTSPIIFLHTLSTMKQPVSCSSGNPCNSHRQEGELVQERLLLVDAPPYVGGLGVIWILHTTFAAYNCHWHDRAFPLHLEHTDLGDFRL